VKACAHRSGASVPAVTLTTSRERMTPVCTALADGTG